MPDYATIPSLCEALEITVAELLDGEDSEPNSLRLYDDKQVLELIAMTQTRAATNSILEAAHSIMIGIALIAIALALYNSDHVLSGFVAGLALVVIILGIYSAVEEARYAVKVKS